MATQSSHSQQLMRSERRMFSASDDSALMKQIQSTHSPDGRFLDVKPILQVIDNVLRHLTPTIDHHALNVQSQVFPLLLQVIKRIVFNWYFNL